ncbi:DsbA family oxidoreductase [Aquisalimonas asiatica]|uniref:Predicted dithiol-disulfide isomerase, DsbA family n=1 Tax=Aquisalimonas asiatica TaxID=406100 RepID=A0A1H8QAT8_9GAMM|nr:DsbA family protein [Aquisalimonas asiatica]SEO51044.1 Predicted dithiol-disulfide isomerase, DsbA family [Aquisalimonas asiatica]
MRKDPAVPVTLFFDYNCPFCYVANHRLERLNARYGLDILWRFLETRPEAPGGDPATPDLLKQPALQALLQEEELPWQPPETLPNTRRALLLAQAVLLYRRPRFPAIHRAVFHAVFGEGRDIGDAEVLSALAQEAGVEDLLTTAWQTPEPVEAVLSHVQAAQALGLANVPALVVAERPFQGAVSTALLEQALRQAAQGGA